MATENQTELLKALERRGVRVVGEPEHLASDPTGGSRGKGWYATIQGPDGTETVYLGLSAEAAMAEVSTGKVRQGVVGTREASRVKSGWVAAAEIGVPAALSAGLATTDGFLRHQGKNTAATVANLVVASIGLATATKAQNAIVRDVGKAAFNVGIANEARDKLGPYLSRLKDERDRKAKEEEDRKLWESYTQSHDRDEGRREEPSRERVEQRERVAVVQ